MYMCSLESAFCGALVFVFVYVCRQTENKINNHVSEQEKEGEQHRVAGTETESFGACYISIRKSKRNITMYVVTVAVVVLLFVPEKHHTAFVSV